jgi:hypothetical protein
VNATVATSHQVLRRRSLKLGSTLCLRSFSNTSDGLGVVFKHIGKGPPLKTTRRESGFTPVTRGSHSESQAQMDEKLSVGVTLQAQMARSTWHWRSAPTTWYPLATLYAVSAAYSLMKTSVRQLGLQLPAPYFLSTFLSGFYPSASGV